MQLISKHQKLGAHEGVVVVECQEAGVAGAAAGVVLAVLTGQVVIGNRMVVVEVAVVEVVAEAVAVVEAVVEVMVIIA